MEIATLGKHELAVCPHCDKLFHIEMTDEHDIVDTLDRIDSMYQKHIAESSKCREARDAIPSMRELQETVGPAMRRADDDRKRRLSEHPNNGTLGYWLVTGIRHDARCRAITATEAVQKCIDAGAVGDWESPEAEFLGTQLPEVF